jgi:hypothetical protein
MPAIFCTREGHDDRVYLTAATWEELARKIRQHAAEMHPDLPEEEVEMMEQAVMSYKVTESLRKEMGF